MPRWSAGDSNGNKGRYSSLVCKLLSYKNNWHLKNCTKGFL